MLLTITADDFGFDQSYDRGIIEAARSGALDSVSVTSGRLKGVPQRLVETGVELGLHLEMSSADDLAEQWEAFTNIFGAPPAYLDGHKHSHLKSGEVIEAVIELAYEWELPVRSVESVDRMLLRERGVQTQDVLFGRYHQREELVEPPTSPGWTEWFTHPGYPLGHLARSSYDAGRGDDLKLLLSYQPPDGVRRLTHRAAAAERSQLG